MAEGKYVVVTGASSGIGYETAKAFAALGKHVIVAARRVERLEKLKAEILAAHPDCDVVLKAVDLSSDETTQDFYDSLADYDIEVFVNNAGRGNNGDLTAPDIQPSREMVQTNVNAVATLSALYVRDYQDVEGAQLINVSSIGGYLLVKGAVLYCATKFFVSVLTEGIDREMQAKGRRLRAKVLAPGSTETEFEKVANDLDDFDYAKERARFATAAEMAGYLIELYQGDKCVGEMDFENGGVKLSDPHHPYWAG